MAHKSFILFLTFAFIFPSQAQQWYTDASVLFTMANSLYTDNDQIASYVIKQLELDWTDKNGEKFEYMVFVNDETIETADYINAGKLDENKDFHKISDHKKTMTAFRYPEANATCNGDIDKDNFKSILDLSVTSSSTAKSMKTAVESTGYFTYTPLGFIVNSETVKAGFKMTSGLDPRCFIQYTYTTKWQVFFYGLQKNLTDTSSESIILNGILGDMLGESPPPDNSLMAYNIQQKLEAQNRGYHWVVFVNDFVDTDTSVTTFDFFIPDAAYWTEDLEVEGFCGKNVRAFGQKPTDGECIPGYNPVYHFEDVVNTVLTNSSAVPADVNKGLADACTDFGLVPKIIASIKDTSAGLDYILDRDCTFDLIGAGSSKNWLIMMYSVVDTGN